MGSGWCGASKGDQFSGALIAFGCHHAPAFRILIVGAARNAAVSWPAEHRPARRQFLRDLGHSAAKEFRGPKIGRRRSDVATLVYVGLASHPQRVAVAVEDVLVAGGTMF